MERLALGRCEDEAGFVPFLARGLAFGLLALLVCGERGYGERGQHDRAPAALSLGIDEGVGSVKALQAASDADGAGGQVSVRPSQPKASPWRRSTASATEYSASSGRP